MRIHILGICGTFMGGLAMLARSLGHQVTGSDANVYPPMSTQLEEQGIALIIVPLICRAALLGLFLTTTYVRAGGLGQALADHLPRKTGWQVLAGSAAACVAIAGFDAVVALLLAVVVFIWLRHLMVRRLGGTTGDTAGALLELLEMSVLVGLALF